MCEGSEGLTTTLSSRVLFCDTGAEVLSTIEASDTREESQLLLRRNMPEVSSEAHSVTITLLQRFIFIGKHEVQGLTARTQAHLLQTALRPLQEQQGGAITHN